MKNGKFCIIRSGTRYDNKATSSYYLLEISDNRVCEEFVMFSKKRDRSLSFKNKNLYKFIRKTNDNFFLINDNLLEMLFLDKDGFYFSKNIDIKNKHLFEKAELARVKEIIIKLKTKKDMMHV